MRDHEQAMLAYATLAHLAEQKQQLGGRGRFLILAGAAACRAGWPEVAARCRDLVLEHNPQHLMRGHATFADALRSPDFQPYLRQLERLCGYERAEHLLDELGMQPDRLADEPETTSGARALRILDGSN